MSLIVDVRIPMQRNTRILPSESDNNTVPEHFTSFSYIICERNQRETIYF